MKSVNMILQYLKGTPSRGIHLRKNPNKDIEIYTNSDCVGCISYRKSTTGYYSLGGGDMVIWRSKKQFVIVRSST